MPAVFKEKLELGVYTDCKVRIMGTMVVAVLWTVVPGKLQGDNVNDILVGGRESMYEKHALDLW
jgi:hypothetical protein